ncbi:MAG: hypothetical protein ABJN22_13700 [Litorimonas sp.]
MTKTETLMADLEEASRIAKAGENTPLVGGPIGLMWGVLLTTTFSIHYLILERILPIPEWSFAILWIGFAVIGGLGSAILGPKVGKKPGAYSTANRVENNIWVMFTAAIGSVAFGVLLNLFLTGGSHELWTIILIMGFAGQGLAYGVIAKMTGHGWLHFASFAGCTMAAVTMSFYGQNVIYLIAAIGSIITIIIPSLLSMKAAR